MSTPIYSRITGELLHIIIRSQDVKEGRADICDPSQCLQIATLRLPQGQTFKPHRHIEHTLPALGRAQETWIVIRGNVEVTLYDVDDTIIHRDILQQGDASVTFNAGHNYEIFTADSMIYEVKTGPYLGQSEDKIFI